MANDSLHENIESQTNGAMNRVSEAAGDAGSGLRDAARKFGAQAIDLGDQAWGQAVEAGRYVDRQVREQPWLLALATGVLGALAGAMVMRAATAAARPRSARDYVQDYLPRQLRRR
jgi:ElaB/YqjD/DUF883 family membrane-anchored ribosome-binding protein